MSLAIDQAMRDVHAARLAIIVAARREQQALEAAMLLAVPPTPAQIDAVLARRASSPHAFLRLQAE